ncbi:hypothetical protein SLA2020_223790 [Shorea laevis]
MSVGKKLNVASLERQTTENGHPALSVSLISPLPTTYQMNSSKQVMDGAMDQSAHQQMSINQVHKPPDDFNALVGYDHNSSIQLVTGVYSHTVSQ